MNSLYTCAKYYTGKQVIKIIHWFEIYRQDGLLSRQTESVRDHKFHSRNVIHRWLSQIGGILFRTCIKLKSKQRESGASQFLHALFANAFRNEAMSVYLERNFQILNRGSVCLL